MAVATVYTEKFLPNVAGLILLRDGSWLGMDGQKKIVIKRWVRKLNRKGDVTMLCNNVFELPNEGIWFTIVKLAEGKNDSFFCFLNFDLIRWNYKTGQKEMTYSVVRPSKHSRTRDLAVLQEDFFATANGTPDITLWQLDKKDPIDTLSHSTGIDISGLCSVTAGAQLASRSNDGTIKIWDVINRFCVMTIESPPMNRYSDDYQLFEWGTSLIAANNFRGDTFEVFDINSGAKVLERKGIGRLLNKEVVFLYRRRIAFLMGGSIDNPVSEFLKQNGESVHKHNDDTTVQALLELHPGAFAIVNSWEVDVGFRDIQKQKITILRWTDER